MKVVDHIKNANGRTLFSIEILPPLKGENIRTLFDNGKRLSVRAENEDMLAGACLRRLRGHRAARPPRRVRRDRRDGRLRDLRPDPGPRRARRAGAADHRRRRHGRLLDRDAAQRREPPGRAAPAQARAQGGEPLPPAFHREFFQGFGLGGDGHCLGILHPTTRHCETSEASRGNPGWLRANVVEIDSI